MVEGPFLFVYFFIFFMPFHVASMFSFSFFFTCDKGKKKPDYESKNGIIYYM